MTRWTVILVLVLGGQAWGEPVTAKLSPVDEADAAIAPYRWAELTLTNGSATAIEAVRLRPAGGGPAVRYPFATPPGKSTTRSIALPALWQEQQYELTALDAAGGTVGEAAAPISWPAKLVTTDDFVDESYDAWRDPAPLRPQQARGESLLLLCGMVIAAAGLLLFRRTLVRVVAAVVLACAACAAVLWLPAWPEPLRKQSYALAMYTPGSPPRVDSFTVLSAWRDTDARLRTPTIPFAVYATRRSAMETPVEVRPADYEAILPIRAGQCRIVRPAEGVPKAPVAAGGSVGPVGEGQLDVQADFPRSRAWLVSNDRFWPLDAGLEPIRMTIHSDSGKPIAALLGEPAANGLSSREARLLDYWRMRYVRPGEVYVVDFPMPGEPVRLNVLSLTPSRPAPQTQPASAPTSIPTTGVGR